MGWNLNVNEIQCCLNALSATIGITNEEVDNDFAFKQWNDWTQNIRRRKRTVYLIAHVSNIVFNCFDVSEDRLYSPLVVR